jgi:hypothetical protein
VAPNKGYRTQLLAREAELWCLPRPAAVAGDEGPVVVGVSASPSRPAVEARGSLVRGE